MRKWRIDIVEPSLDDLLGDEIMVPIMRSAGVSPEDLRRQIKTAACRFARRRGGEGSDHGCRMGSA